MRLCTRQKRHHLSQSTLNLYLDNQVIEQVDSYKYLGVTIDQNISFNIHVENIINKISRSLGILKRSSPFLALASRKTLYNTLVLPDFDYCCTLWDVCSDTNISRLQQLQNRGMRIVLGCHHRTHVSDMLSTLKWLNVRQRFHLLKCTMMYNIVKGNTPTYNLLVNIGISHKYGTRAIVE